MTRRAPTPPSVDVEETIVDIDVAEEMRASFLEYAYSVIYSRALPDARDGLKPVQRRILYQMHRMGLRPDRGHVKCARVVGEVMGRLHPHGDSAIYDALVRLAQPWVMRLPLVDGHGNFGSPGGDDAPAAMRYTEARLTAAAIEMVNAIDEDTVGFQPNYDGQETEPEVLPAGLPNQLVNGAAGIAVGMATTMAPHNLGEVVAAARYLLAHPDASLDDLMRFVPGPDLPGGGRIIGRDGIRDAYATGRGTFRMRATCRVERISSRRVGIVVTELPYGVGPEKVIARIKDLVQAKKLTGIADVKDLTDAGSGLRLVIEVRGGVDPAAVLDDLYRLTPLEEGFGINNVALVDGQPRTLGLRDLLEIYVEHRLDVVRRRSEFRRRRRDERLHLVNGLLVALLDIDAVIAVIRSSDDADAAKERLMATFGLSVVQAQHILDTPLRRLTRYDRLALEREADTLRREIAELTDILSSDTRLRRVVSDELGEVARRFATPRRSVLLDEDAAPPAGQPEATDAPCTVLLSATGRLARVAVDATAAGTLRSGHEVVVGAARTTTRSAVAAVTSAGRVVGLDVRELPELRFDGQVADASAGVPVSAVVPLTGDETVVAVAALDAPRGGLLLGTARGMVKRVLLDASAAANGSAVIALSDGDRVVGAVPLDDERQDLVFVTSDGHLLRFPAAAVRPRGGTAAGTTGVRLVPGAAVTWFGAVDPTDPDAVVVTVAGAARARPGTAAVTVKVCRYDRFPVRNRGGRGVRCHRFRAGEDALLLAWVGPGPAVGVSRTGTPIELPGPYATRDGTGIALTHKLVAVGRAAFSQPLGVDH